MAKKIKFNFLQWENQHYKAVEYYAREIERLYDSFANEAAQLGLSVKNFSGDKPFSFANFPQTKEGINKILNDLYKNITLIVEDGTRQEWLAANLKNDELVNKVFKNQNLKSVQLNNFYQRNLQALSAFQERKEQGFSLSERIWRLTRQTRQELEMSLDIALADGRSAAELSRDIRQYLQDPNKLFRRVRNKHGNLQLSKNAAAYHPGQGVYRSSARNAQRLARSEINMAYRASDVMRMQQLDFVIGYEVKRSKREYPCMLCESLAGKYRKDFKFVGWHPQCRCYLIPILASVDEFNDYQRRLLAGEDLTGYKFSGEVTSLPVGFMNWTKENEPKIVSAKSLPYFVADNSSLIFDKPTYLLKRTKLNIDTFGQTSEAIADKVGVVVTDVNIKSDKRIFDKAKSDYNGEVLKVRDIIRNTFLANEAKQGQLIEEIKKRFNVERIKSQLSETDPLGYSGTIINIRFANNTFGEIQINSAAILYGKDLSAKHIIGNKLFEEIKKISGLEPGMGHVYYEEYRKLDKLKAAKRMAELEKLSRRYYEALRRLRL